MPARRKLTHLMIHCSATPEGRYYDKKDILQWHTGPKTEGGRGWKKPGYADIILLDGLVQNLVPYDGNDHIEGWEISNGAKGWNGHTRHICYIGGTDLRGKVKDTRTIAQRRVLEIYVRLSLRFLPKLKLIGHNQVAEKGCPSFDVRRWAKEIGIKDENIDFNNYAGNDFIGEYDGS